MKFCNQCGNLVERKVPVGDSRMRYVCTQCNTIHYENPKIVSGTLPLHQSKILLCKRAIEPRKGYWTLPAGFMENQESTVEAAIRETWEEARAEVDIINLYTIIDVPQINQVHLFFLANLTSPNFSAGEESLEVDLFDLDAIPWSDIAFPTVSETLKQYQIDHEKQEGFPLHTKSIRRPATRVKS